MIQDFLLPLDSPWHPSQRLSPKVRMPGERILKVTKKSGNRGRCRKLSLWNWFLVRQLTCQTSPRFLGYDFLSLFFSSYWRVLWSTSKDIYLRFTVSSICYFLAINYNYSTLPELFFSPLYALFSASDVFLVHSSGTDRTHFLSLQCWK